VPQVHDAPECADCAIRVAMLLSTPSAVIAQDRLWQKPLHPASLIAPSVMDSCFMLLAKLSSPPGATCSGSSSTRRSSSGSGPPTSSRDKLVCD
jgi:hypothetical protein